MRTCCSTLLRCSNLEQIDIFLCAVIQNSPPHPFKALQRFWGGLVSTMEICHLFQLFKREGRHFYKICKIHHQSHQHNQNVNVRNTLSSLFNVCTKVQILKHSCRHTKTITPTTPASQVTHRGAPMLN